VIGEQHVKMKVFNYKIKRSLERRGISCEGNNWYDAIFEIIHSTLDTFCIYEIDPVTEGQVPGDTDNVFFENVPLPPLADPGGTGMILAELLQTKIEYYLSRVTLGRALALHPSAVMTVDWPTIVQYVEQRTTFWKEHSHQKLDPQWNMCKGEFIKMLDLPSSSNAPEVEVAIKKNFSNERKLLNFFKVVARLTSVEIDHIEDDAESMDLALQNVADVLEGWDTFHTLPDVLGELLREDLRMSNTELTPGDIVNEVRLWRLSHKAYPDLIRDQEKKHRLIQALHHSQRAMEHLIKANKSLWKQIPEEEAEENE
jgi:hypothetical protein